MNGNSQPNRTASFRAQPFDDQLSQVWERGLLLDARRIPGFWLHLYALDTDFVEMWIGQHAYEISLLRLLERTDDLAPYLDKISLDPSLLD